MLYVCYSALYGATFAFTLLLAQRYNIIDDNNLNNLFSPRVSFFVAVLALLGIIATSTYAIICPNRFEFIDIHTYIVVVPVSFQLFIHSGKITMSYVNLLCIAKLCTCNILFLYKIYCKCTLL